MHFSAPKHLQLVLDNMGALAQLIWGRAKAHLSPQHRILRRLGNKLMRLGVLVLSYVDSGINHRVSRARSFSTTEQVVVQARVPLRLYQTVGGHVCWEIADRDRGPH